MNPVIKNAMKVQSMFSADKIEFQKYKLQEIFNSSPVIPEEESPSYQRPTTSPKVRTEDKDIAYEQEAASANCQPPQKPIRSKPMKPSGSTILSGPMTMRKAIIMSEILDKPLALRRKR